MTAWVSLPSTDVDADSPMDTDLATALVDRNQHLYEFLTGGTVYSGLVPHAHAGTNEAVIGDATTDLVSGPNLIMNACPQNDPEHWSRSGFGHEGNTYQEGGDASGDYMYHVILEQDNGDDQRTLFGTGGTPFVVSLFARLSTSGTVGELRFGIADGSTTTFTTGHAAVVNATDMSTSWKRFWALLDDQSPATKYPAANHSTDVRFLLKTETAFAAHFHVGGFMCCQSNGVLLPFSFAPHDDDIADYPTNHTPSYPVWDTTVSMDNAVQASRI